MIFDHHDYWQMAEATEALSGFGLLGPTLTNVAIRIATIDDPYYSRLQPRTYMAAARLASPSEILALVERFGS